MDPIEEILRKAQAALAAGESPAEVNADIAAKTNGQYRDFAALQGAVPSPEARERPNPSLGQRASDILRMGVHGATLNWSDDILGIGPGGAERTAASRERIARLRQDHPLQSLLAEGAGGMVIPGGVGLKVGGKVLAGTGSRAAAGAEGGAVGGGAGGAVVGAGEADGGIGERAAGGVVGGAVGGVLGGVLGGGMATAGNFMRGSGEKVKTSVGRSLAQHFNDAGVKIDELGAALKASGPGSVVADLSQSLAKAADAAVSSAAALSKPGGPMERILRRNSGREERMARELGRVSGTRLSFDESRALAKTELRAEADRLYGPFERAYPGNVEGDNILRALEHPDINPLARTVSRRHRQLENVMEQGVAPGMARTLAPGASFKELQEIRKRIGPRGLAGRARRAGDDATAERYEDAYGVLTDAIEQDLPGFREANAAYRVGIRRVDAHDLGQRLAFKPTRDIQKAMNDLPPEAHDSFRRGLLDEFEQRLRDEKGGGGALFNKLVTPGESMEDRLRLVLGGDERLREMIAVGSREGRWARTAAQISGNSKTAPRQESLKNLITEVQGFPTRVFRSLMEMAEGLSPQEQTQVSEAIGRILLGEGEEAAREAMTNVMVARSISAGAASAAGALGAGGMATQDERQPLVLSFEGVHQLPDVRPDSLMGGLLQGSGGVAGGLLGGPRR